MIQTIIQRADDFKRSNPKEFLKLNKLLKLANIKKLERRNNNGDRVGKETYYKELTLLNQPRINESEGRSSYVNGYTNDEIGAMDNFFSEFSWGYLYDGNEEIVIKIGDVERIVGYYYKDRNLIICAIGLCFDSYTRRKFQNHLIKLFLERLEEMKLEDFDNKEIIKNRIIREFTYNARQSIQTKTNTISQNEQNIKDNRQIIDNNYKENLRLKVEIEGLGNLEKHAEKKLQSEISNIRKLKFVKRVTLNEKGIRVDLGRIFITEGKEKVRIGDFVVHLLPSRVQIENKTPILSKLRNNEEGGDIWDTEYRGVELTHPHINTDGTICYGNRQEKIEDLRMELKFGQLVYFLYLYLKSYNGADSYSKLKNWVWFEKEGGWK